jgi:hypothetical protein
MLCKDHQPFADQVDSDGNVHGGSPIPAGEPGSAYFCRVRLPSSAVVRNHHVGVTEYFFVFFFYFFIWY